MNDEDAEDVKDWPAFIRELAEKDRLKLEHDAMRAKQIALDVPPGGLPPIVMDDKYSAKFEAQRRAMIDRAYTAHGIPKTLYASGLTSAAASGAQKFSVAVATGAEAYEQPVSDWLAVGESAERVLGGTGSDADVLALAKSFLEITDPTRLKRFLETQAAIIRGAAAVADFQTAVEAHAEANRFNPASWTGSTIDRHILSGECERVVIRYPSAIKSIFAGRASWLWRMVRTASARTTRVDAVCLYPMTMRDGSVEMFLSYALNPMDPVQAVSRNSGGLCEAESVAVRATEHLLAGALFFLGIIPRSPGGGV